MKKKLLSLFSGCGGMDIGFEGGFKISKSMLNKEIHKDWIDKENGRYIFLKETIFDTAFANDISVNGYIAWNDYFSKRNKPSDTYKLGSIVDYVKEYKKGNFLFPENIDIVTGGFPCQDFSIAGKRNGFNSHKDHNGIKNTDANLPSEETRGKLYMWMKEVIEITKPKIFIAENVKGLANLGDVKKIIQNDFSNIGNDGYLVLNPRVLHAANYGISQSRERIFFIGFKKSELTEEALVELNKEIIDDNFSPYPIPTHRNNVELNFSDYSHLLKPFTKLKDILKDLKEPSDSEDFSQKFFSKAKYMGKHCQGQNEINLDKIAPTIRAEHHGNIEFRRLSTNNGGKYDNELKLGLEERRLTLRECARIQTFPDDFNFVIPKNNSINKFELSPSQGYKLVGNAVPPLLAYHIAKKIESNWTLYFKSH